MDINKVLIEYDGMFGRCSLDDIEDFLVNNIEVAKDEKDLASCFTLLNEIIGFCRDTTQKDKGIMFCQELKVLMNDMRLEGKLEYATALLNIANAYRAFGLSEESMECYEKTLEIYKEKLEDNDFGYANLYNNWALLYQEMGDFEGARDCLYKALRVVDSYSEAVIQQAITRTNLGSTLVAIGTEEACSEAEKFLGMALTVFEKDGGRDFHYNAALVAMGDLMCRRERYGDGANYYERGLTELKKHVGENDNYTRVLNKLKFANRLAAKYEMEKNFDAKSEDILEATVRDNLSGNTLNDCGAIWKSNMTSSREFYENYGKKMIHEKFPDYEDRIAVGLVGAGSECFGFDDEISMDHDYGVGFQLWLTKEDFREIGGALHLAYDELLVEAGVCDSDVGRLADRRGVFEIRSFYEEYLGENYSLEEGLYRYKDYQLAAATNGEIYRDDLGEFTAIRNRLLGYYNDKEWRHKLVKSIHDFSQYGQSNYARMMAREDYVTANICICNAIESAMDIVYLLAKTYAPYYKWKYKGLEKLIEANSWKNTDKLVDMCGLLEQLSVLDSQKKAWKNVKYDATVVNYSDEKIVVIEKLAAILLSELKSQNIVVGDELFLQSYESQILRGKCMSSVDKIIELEWEMFDKVKNEGGRADCQDDWKTFSLMRKSQYMAWDEELRESYLQDLEIAKSKGWNMIMEKYARMMESTCPKRFEELEKALPAITEDRIAIQENIIAIQVAWMEEFAARYPKMAGNSRTIRTHTDNEFNTSYETYLRGELSTYSERTFVLYGRFIAGLMQEGKNVAYEIMKNTALGYGYESVEDAESRL